MPITFKTNLLLMKNLILISFCLFFKPSLIAAQSCRAGTSRADLRGVNAMRAAFLNSGDMFWDLNESQFGLEGRLTEPFRSTIFAGGIWLGGKDQTGNIRLAASTYRSSSSNDFFPGPMQSVQMDAPACAKWDKHWVTTRVDIERHVSQLNYLGRITDTITNIFSWPGRNNPYFRRFNGFDLPVNQSFAPFFDKNRDGNYTPQYGDYPLPENVKPEAAPTTMNWCIFNDFGNLHTNAVQSLPISAEIHQTAWAYNAGSSNLIDSCIFTSHKIIHKGSQVLDSFSIGLWIDFDLGCYSDDFVGSFPSSNTFYVYNRDSFDNTICDQNVRGFGLNPPVQAVTFLNKSLSKFMTIYNPSVSNPLQAMTDPVKANEFFNVLNGRWRDGTPLTASRLGYNPNATNFTNFAFSGVPNDTSQWSMHQENRRSALSVLDIRTIGSTYIGRFSPLDTARLDVVYSLHRNLNADNLQNIPIMIGGLPKIFNIYQNQFQVFARPVSVEDNNISFNIKVYPNPSTDDLWVKSDNALIEDITIFNAFGQLIPVEKTLKNAQFNVNVKPLSNGFYFLKIKINGKTTTRKIVIQH